MTDPAAHKLVLQHNVRYSCSTALLLIAYTGANKHVCVIVHFSCFELETLIGLASAFALETLFCVSYVFYVFCVFLSRVKMSEIPEW